MFYSLQNWRVCELPSFFISLVLFVLFLNSKIVLREIRFSLICRFSLLLCIPQGIFERFDRDRSGKIDSTELRDALLSLGFAVSPVVLDLLVSKFDKTGGKSKAIEYDNFIE